MASIKGSTETKYYQRELKWLRMMSEQFAGEHPKIANRLKVSGDESADPHVERLIESFAFLTGYLQQDIDNNFPYLGSALLSTIYPQFTTPIPPLSIAQFVPGGQKGKMTTGYDIPKDFPLFAETSKGEVCRFKTCYDTCLYPLLVDKIGLVRSSDYDFSDELLPHCSYLIRINIHSTAEPVNKLDIDHLRFYIDTDIIDALALYEAIFLEEANFATIVEGENEPCINPLSTIKPVGFSDNETVIPTLPQSLSSYRLLHEYFAFYEKFSFFDLVKPKFKGNNKSATILIPLSSRIDPRNILFSDGMLRLGCTPIINLFSRISEPIRMDNKKIEYRLVGDIRRELFTEIHSIKKMSSTTVDAPETKILSPYFSFDHTDFSREQDSFWFTRRVPSVQEHFPGTDMFVSFVNLNFSPETPSIETLYAHTLCTNRGLATLISPGTTLQPDAEAPTEKIVCLHQPTGNIYPESDGAKLWKLISNLSLNKLSLTSNPEALKGLKDILMMYTYKTSSHNKITVDSISSLKTEPVVRRLGTEAWRGFCKGTLINLTIDETLTAGHTSFLFTQVLSNFFQLYTSINSFTELHIYKTNYEEVWKKWPINVGGKTLL